MSGGGGKIFVLTTPVLKFRVNIRVGFKAGVRFRFRVRFRVKVIVNDRVSVGMVFMVSMRFPLLIQWRGTGGNLSRMNHYTTEISQVKVSRNTEMFMLYLFSSKPR